MKIILAKDVVPKLESKDVCEKEFLKIPSIKKIISEKSKDTSKANEILKDCVEIHFLELCYFYGSKIKIKNQVTNEILSVSLVFIKDSVSFKKTIIFQKHFSTEKIEIHVDDKHNYKFFVIESNLFLKSLNLLKNLHRKIKSQTLN
jgi:hypothetical protein